MALYIGEREVASMEDAQVTFVDGAVETYTERQLKYIVTQEPKDATAFRDMLIVEFTKDILTVIEGHDVRKGDIDKILEIIVQSYNAYFNRGIGLAMGTYDETKYHTQFIDDITISDIKRIEKEKREPKE